MTSAIKYIFAIPIFLACLSGAAQEKRDSLKLASGTKKPVPDSLTVKEYSDDYLDTVKIEKKFILNDYSSIGIEYGVSMNQMWFTPTMTQQMFVCPNTIGVFYTKYHSNIRLVFAILQRAINSRKIKKPALRKPLKGRLR